MSALKVLLIKLYYSRTKIKWGRASINLSDNLVFVDVGYHLNQCILEILWSQRLLVTTFATELLSKRQQNLFCRLIIAERNCRDSELR